MHTSTPMPTTIAGVPVTNLDRVVYPDAGVTKGDLFDYYEAVAELMLPHVARRLLTLVRHPKGLGGDAFFQKHGGEGTPAIVPRLLLPKQEAEGREPYVYVEDLRALVALVQIGVLEFHVWNSRVPDVALPDQIVFDLDPGPGVAFADVVAAARDVRRRLESAGLVPFVKTTGGAGLHVIAPIVPEHGWDVVTAFAKIVARRLARDEPERYIDRVAKSRRSGRIFVDWMRNGWNRNQVAAWSTRARPGATVSMPLRWPELKPSLDPARFDVRGALRRARTLKRDPWADFEASRVRLTLEMAEALDATSSSRTRARGRS